MTTDSQISKDSKALAREIAGYLAAVEAFRALGCEPTWRPERGVAKTAARRILVTMDVPITWRRPLGPPRFSV